MIATELEEHVRAALEYFNEGWRTLNLHSMKSVINDVDV